MAGMDHLTTATVTGSSTSKISITVSSYTDYHDLLILGTVSQHGTDAGIRDLYMDFNDLDGTANTSGYVYIYHYRNSSGSGVNLAASDNTGRRPWASSDDWWMGEMNTVSTAGTAPGNYGQTPIRCFIPSFRQGEQKRGVIAWSAAMQDNSSASGSNSLTRLHGSKKIEELDSIQFKTGSTSYYFKAGSTISVYGYNKS